MPLQHVPFPAEVLHELAGQFDRVPFDAGDARHRQVVDPVSMWCRPWPNSWNSVITSSCVKVAGLSPTGAWKVAGQVGHRRLQPPSGRRRVRASSIQAPAALGVARVQVEVELADQLALAARSMRKKRTSGCQPAPRRGLIHAEQPLDDATEQAVQHLGFGEVLLHLLVGERVALLRRRSRRIGHVPGLQVVQTEFAAGEGAQFVQIALAKGLARTARSRRKPSPARACRPSSAPATLRRSCRKPSIFASSARSDEDAVDQRTVVERRVAEFRGAGGAGAVHARAQLAVVGVLHAPAGRTASAA
jgi:hypothetical protein